MLAYGFIDMEFAVADEKHCVAADCEVVLRVEAKFFASTIFPLVQTGLLVSHA